MWGRAGVVYAAVTVILASTFSVAAGSALLHRSTWMRQELGAMLLARALCDRLEVRRLTQPPRSGDLPGKPSGL
jgi:hypothetical protein